MVQDLRQHYNLIIIILLLKEHIPLTNLIKNYFFFIMK